MTVCCYDSMTVSYYYTINYTSEQACSTPFSTVSVTMRGSVCSSPMPAISICKTPIVCRVIVLVLVVLV
jgi:hypothetical protein